MIKMRGKALPRSRRRRPRKEPTAISYGALGAMLTWWAISNWADYAHGRRGWNFVLSTIALTAAALFNYWRGTRAFRAENAKER